ncbi:hypothetical protein [Aureispira anguillae]|uniref:Tetratricopeptide repeat protein n=1 Tax=Aureispira anguillae TaxID=2864201 RepID=A0A916DSN3_9BACT|nr:hypothetical protein [Aureispira anguillae]BDS12639.1 hypothetical protein AsAng_0033630 [Aureispira anguillae]
MSKTVLLIKALSPHERKRFKQQLKKNRRAGIYPLYIAIEKQLPNSAPKPYLFEQVFNKAYSPKEDYLFRNIQRHLNKKLKHFLALQSKLENNKIQQEELQLLTLLLERKQYKLFRTEWQQAYKTSKKQAQYQHQIALTQLYITYVFKHEEIQETTYLHLKELVTETLMASTWAGQEQYQELEIKLAIIERYLFAFNPAYKSTIPPRPYPTNQLGQSTVLLHFLDLLKESYLTNRQEKINVLEQVLELYPQIVQIRQQYKNKELSLLGSLALEYFMLQKFDKAAKVYQQLMPQLQTENSSMNKLSILFNYCSNEAYLGNYTTIISIYNQWQTEFQSIPKFYYRFQYITCMAYLFLGQASQALELLGQDQISQRSESDYYYARNLQAIIYYELEDWDNCERELTNTLQSIRYKSSPNQLLLYRTQFLKDLLRINTAPFNKKETRAKLSLLKQAIQENMHKKHLANPQNLIVQWILKKINQQLTPS